MKSPTRQLLFYLVLFYLIENGKPENVENGENNSRNNSTISIENMENDENISGKNSTIPTENLEDGKNNNGKNVTIPTENMGIGENNSGKNSTIPTENVGIDENNGGTNSTISTESTETGENNRGKNSIIPTENSETGENNRGKNSTITTENSESGKNNNGKNLTIPAENMGIGENNRGKNSTIPTENSETGENNHGKNSTIPTENLENGKNNNGKNSTIPTENSETGENNSGKNSTIPTENLENGKNNSGKNVTVSNYTRDNAIDDITAGGNLLSSVIEAVSAINDTEIFLEIVTPEPNHIPEEVLEFMRQHAPYKFDVSKSNRYLAQDVTEFVCKPGSLCNGTLSQFGGICTTDCMPCRCDKECDFYGDCCPDTAFRESTDVASVSNPYLICITEDWRTWGVDTTNIFMVGKCPPNSDPTIVHKCEFLDITIQREATPVSNVESNVTYRNAFCAECNSFRDYEVWRHAVTCSLASSVQFATSKTDLWRIVVEDSACTIVTKPPESVSLRECYPVHHSTCNGSGNAQKNVDPVVKRLCEMYSHPVHYYGNDYWKTSYRNLFCAICDGARLRRRNECVRIKDPYRTFPLTVLLDFNPPTQRRTQAIKCEIGQAVDPFSNTCVNISCPIRRYLVDNRCEEIFSTAAGLGMAFRAILRMVNNNTVGVAEHGFLDQFSTMLNESLELFSPFAVSYISTRFYTSDPGHALQGPAELVHIQADFISQTTQNLSQLETTLLNLMTGNFSYRTSDNKSIQFQSTPILCPEENMIPPQHREVTFLSKMTRTSLEILDPTCGKPFNCTEKIYFALLPLNCPFVEYNLSQVNFTYFSNNHSISFREHVLDLVPLRHLDCGGFLQICTDELINIRRILENRHDPNQALAIVSLVCMSLSLAGLVLTLITYSLIPKLRTLPGLNTMALVFNLFVAQLLFLTTSNRTSNSVFCQIFGVLIHYFWLSSFGWMSLSAYHMFTVFTGARLNSDSRDTKRFIRYALFTNLLPILIIAACLAVSLARSDGRCSGYGGRVCFLNNPIAVGGFFAAPLGLMLLLNVFFFARTIHAIRSVPDMSNSSNQNNRHHIFVYIKLSLLFGFTWVFGILAEIIRSDELNYVFVVLSGSQGLFLFIAYCLNKRTWSQLSAHPRLGGKYNTANLTSGPPTISSTTKEITLNSN